MAGTCAIDSLSGLALLDGRRDFLEQAAKVEDGRNTLADSQHLHLGHCAIPSFTTWKMWRGLVH